MGTKMNHYADTKMNHHEASTMNHHESSSASCKQGEAKWNQNVGVYRAGVVVGNMNKQGCEAVLEVLLKTLNSMRECMYKHLGPNQSSITPSSARSS